MKKVSSILLISLLPVLGIGQARVFINSGYITLGISGTAIKTDPTYFIIHNPAANAITQTSGGIVSEKEWGMVWWDIGAPVATTTYTVPFSYYNSTVLPLTISMAAGNGGTASGAGTGTLLLSTWHGTAINCNGYGANIADNQCYMPSDVTNMYPATSVSAPDATDDSWYAADRFWVIDANTGYSTKPSPSITFSYLNSTSGNSEIASPNTITESALIPQRFNSGLQTWGDWTAGSQTVSDLASVGTLAMGVTVPASGFYRSWVLASSDAPLPIVLLSFTAECDNGLVMLNWSSATESNNATYTVERSEDGTNYQTVRIVKGAGTSSSTLNYSVTDNTPITGTMVYYRLSQTDFDGKTTILNTIPFAGCAGTVNTVEAYNANGSGTINININAVYADNYTITVLTLLGQPILTKNYSAATGENTFTLHTSAADGIYILNVRSDKMNYNKKLFIGK